MGVNMNINDLLKIAIENDASDLHLKVGNYPILRISGKLKPLTNLNKLTADDTKALSEQITTDFHKEILKKNLDVDLAYSVAGFGRFRGSIYRQRGSLAIVLRIIPLQVESIPDLLLPDIIKSIAMESRGLVLVTGTTGSGKSTTLASMIDHINSNRSVNIITIEDPIEYLHRDKRSMINQREVGSDVIGFAHGLRASLREDPDVILVGEMRDHDTIETALLAAETGHLVLSTVHTLDAPETINRIVTVFAPHHHKQVRLQLASILKAVISMRLIPKKEGEGRVPAVEVMINTPYIAECITNKDKTNLIRDAISSGVSQYNMQTFDQSIYHLFQKGYISYDQGMQFSTSPDQFKLRVIGIQSTSDLAKEDMEKTLKSFKESNAKIPKDKPE